MRRVQVRLSSPALRQSLRPRHHRGQATMELSLRARRGRADQPLRTYVAPSTRRLYERAALRHHRLSSMCAQSASNLTTRPPSTPSTLKPSVSALRPSGSALLRPPRSGFYALPSPSPSTLPSMSPLTTRLRLTSHDNTPHPASRPGHLSGTSHPRIPPSASRRLTHITFRP